MTRWSSRALARRIVQPLARWIVRPSPVELVALVWFAIAVWRSKWISDDGYIYLTYVERFLSGDGAEFNVGESVEAYTSVAWFALLAVGGAVVRFVTLETLVLLVSIAISIVAVAVLPATERAAAALRGVAADRWAGSLNLPMLVVAATYVFTSFATSGLETPLLLLWLSLVVREVWAVDRRPRVLAGLAGLGPLVRPDLGLVAIMLAVLAWRATAAGRWRTVAACVAPVAVSGIVRVAVYGQLVPNTVYAKTGTGHGWSEGVTYLRDTAGPYWLSWQVAAAVAVVAVPPVRRLARGAGRSALDAADRRGLLLLAAAAVTALQVLVVGGDFMHGRFWITPWFLLLGTLAGLGSLGVDRLAVRLPYGSRPAARSAAVALAFGVPLLLLLEPVTSDQRRVAADRFFQIGDITDEQAYYASVNPAIHELTPDNEFFLFRLGRDLSALSERMGVELGVTAGAIGQISYAGATGPGDVFVYDLVGLTRLDVSRLEVVGDTRVGHARSAPDVLVATHPRVDFHPVSAFDGYAEAFSVTIGGQALVLVAPDLIDDLSAAGAIDDATSARMTTYLHDAIAGPVVDANLLTFLRERSTEDAVVAERLVELADVERSSSWRRWLVSTAAERSELASDGCGGRNWFACLELAIDRHLADQYPLDVVEPDLRPVEPSG